MRLYSSNVLREDIKASRENLSDLSLAHGSELNDKKIRDW